MLTLCNYTRLNTVASVDDLFTPEEAETVVPHYTYGLYATDSLYDVLMGRITR